ncbi:MAG: hypothetical protein R2725_03370 [Solirubrobacterales bacterium]
MDHGAVEQQSGNRYLGLFRVHDHKGLERRVAVGVRNAEHDVAVEPDPIAFLGRLAPLDVGKLPQSLQNGR